jgi:2-oxoglutarate dehydrogenase complex dehydrogenase (E1) component-like enzyme
MKAYVILQRYKIRGHELADLDPLCKKKKKKLKKKYNTFFK